MSKYIMNGFAKLINDYLEKNNFRFYATIEDGGVSIRYLSDDETVDNEKPYLRYYSYTEIENMYDVIIEDFLTNLGLEIKLEMLVE